MNKTIYVVQQRNSDGNQYAQTFMVFSEALTYFHNICERNNIKSNVWVQTPTELSAKGLNTIIELQINII